MRFAAWFLLASAAHGAVLNHTWIEARLALTTDDGSAEIEWVSPLSFRLLRTWGTTPTMGLKIKHDPVLAALEDLPGMFRMRTRYLTIEVAKTNLAVSVRNGDNALASIDLEHSRQGSQLHIAPMDHVFGLKGGDSSTLDLHGRTFDASGFLFTGHGYGMYFPRTASFDLTSNTIAERGSGSIQTFFYYGPLPKEILEQHQIVTGQTEVTSEFLKVLRENQLPVEAGRLPQTRIDSWEALATLARTLNHWSLSGILYPAFDLSSIGGAVQERAAELASVLPLLYSSRAEGAMPVRDQLGPYLTTYLREAHDRGLPLIHPFAMQFSRDAGADLETGAFLLGDELLVAPVLAPGTNRELKLPRGIWTDLRTNTEYRGNQKIQFDAPIGRVPMFARNGSLVPLSAGAKLELHYFPSLGGEFFLWEPDADDNSQFHAAPAGEFTRVEVESKIGRLYEWVLHHTKAPAEVFEDSMKYSSAKSQAELRPGMWWEDEARNDLHIQLRATAGTDRIISVKE